MNIGSLVKYQFIFQTYVIAVRDREREAEVIRLVINVNSNCAMYSSIYVFLSYIVLLNRLQMYTPVFLEFAVHTCMVLNFIPNMQNRPYTAHG